MVTQLMNQGMNNRQFVSNIVKMQSDLENAQVNRAYTRALTVNAEGAPARALRAHKLELAKMGFNQLKSYHSMLLAQKEQDRKEGKTAKDIEKIDKEISNIDQIMKERQKKISSYVPYTVRHEGAEPVTRDIPFEKMMDFDFKMLASNRQLTQDQLNERHRAFGRSRNRIKTIASKYGGDSGGLSVDFETGKIGAGGQGWYDDLRERAFTVDDKGNPINQDAVNDFRDVNVEMARMGPMKMHRADLPPSVDIKSFKEGESYFITDDATGVEYAVVRKKGDDFLTIEEVNRGKLKF